MVPLLGGAVVEDGLSLQLFYALRLYCARCFLCLKRRGCPSLGDMRGGWNRADIAAFLPWGTVLLRRPSPRGGWRTLGG
jgi:hypothetical protein